MTYLLESPRPPKTRELSTHTSNHEISAFVESDIPQYITQATKTKNKLGF
jgi:hypothetical protein